MPPIKMYYSGEYSTKKRLVYVYQFIYDPETYESGALCWLPNSGWLTVSVALLEPILEETNEK